MRLTKISSRDVVLLMRAILEQEKVENPGRESLEVDTSKRGNNVKPIVGKTNPTPGPESKR